MKKIVAFTTSPKNQKAAKPMHMKTVMASRFHAVALSVVAGSCFLISGAGYAAANVPNNHSLMPQQSPTALTVTNATRKPVYANLVLGQPPVNAPANCSSLGRQVESVADPKLQFLSSIPRKRVTFSGPPGVTTKGAYLMAPGEKITYVPQIFACFKGQKCTPALTANFFFTEGFNGTSTGNNGCGGAGTTYPNATNLAEASINFSANGAVGSTCPNADDTDISAVNGVNALLAVNTTDAGNGKSWPSATSIAANKALGKNTNNPGVFGWAATNCTNPEGFPNPTNACAGPQDAPLAVKGVCAAPMTLITGPNGTQYCAETSATGICNNQRTAFNTGGTVKIIYGGQIAP